MKRRFHTDTGLVFDLHLRAMSVTILVATLIAIFAPSGVNAQNDSRVPGPQFELPAKADQCIRPTDFMRRNHMHLLSHKRDATMRQGIRTKDASLQGCVDCHSKEDENGTAIPVNAPGQFCAACHEYTAVKLDCFECHRTTPDTPLSTTKRPDTPAHNGLLANNWGVIDELKLYLNEAQ